MLLPALFALAWVGGFALLAAAVILRRRGVYFSLLTLAFTAMLYAIAFRWTDLTGGENGIGNLHRWAVLQQPGAYYAAVSGIAFLVLVALWRFRRSPMRCRRCRRGSCSSRRPGCSRGVPGRTR